MNNGHLKPTTIILLVITIIAVVVSTCIALWRLSIQNQLNAAEKEAAAESEAPAPRYSGESSIIPTLGILIGEWKCGILGSEVLINEDGTYSDKIHEIFGTYEYNEQTGKLIIQTTSESISYRIRTIGPKLIMTDQTHEEECYGSSYGD